ncbi:hypothetical protein T440DRAFT_155470 [Plenodomus tracheiphilus IPT5]|uniref:Uncharacterized protein n=1 Tax=Plenodomus tracheiphilus IPT5 TaxID=1408161 RepID=A0A6A7BJQ2_9PLEO|nr:hypothetical protein T440DRAFT_155470 [Plenodomus tracheiphilus IPT5]
MKLLLVLTAFIASVYASLAQNELLGRAIDPATMDPTQLSVLSVLKTALAGVSLPPAPSSSGSPEPEWFVKLPEDVKSLLPELYPATAVAAVAAVDATPTAESTGLSVSPTSQAATATVTAPLIVPTTGSESKNVDSEPLTVALSSEVLNSLIANSTSATLAISEVTITKSLQHVSSVTGTGSLFPTSNGTLTMGTPSVSPTTSVVSGGVRNAVETKALAAVMWVAVGAGFCLFA